MKVNRSLENRGLLLTGTTRKWLVKKEALSMTACLSLIENVFTPLPKSVSIPLQLSAGM